MKTGRPECYIPSAETVSRDVKNVFIHVREKVSKLLRVSLHSNTKDHLQYPRIQEYNGKINFATDAWTSPNHRAFVAITVHIEHDGKPLAFLLDIVEVPKSHTGVNLVISFTEVLKAYGIQDKVRRKEM